MVSSLNPTTAMEPLEIDSNRSAVPTLLEVVRRYGTPTYAFDLERLRTQVAKLRNQLPPAVEILYSLKANASLGICDIFAACGLGADVASAGELYTAREAGFSSERIFVAGPFKLPETIAQLQELPQSIVSVDSPSELQSLLAAGLHNPAVLRLRPDFGSRAVVIAGKESRFGFTPDDLRKFRNLITSSQIPVIGFHIFAGSQVLQAAHLVEHLRGAFQLAVQASEIVGITPQLLNLGGGFGIPYGEQDELDLEPIAAELHRILSERMGSRGETRPRIVLELGRYLVAQAGWYLTSVVGHQTIEGRPAVIVDGGTHQRADLCGLCLRTKARPPLALNVHSATRIAIDVWGCLSLPADVLAEASPLPPLAVGDVLAFPNAGAYGMWSSPAMFHGSPLPAEVGFAGSRIQLMRQRESAKSILRDQQHLSCS